MNCLEKEEDLNIDEFLKNMSPFIAIYLSDNSKTRVQLSYHKVWEKIRH